MVLKLTPEKVIEIAEELDALPAEATGYFNRNTGELYAVQDEFHMDFEDLEDPEIAAGIPEWQKEHIAKQQVVENDDAWIKLPGKFEVHEWQLMREFAEKAPNPGVREDLLEAIHGSGAFRRFKRALDRHDQRDEWFAFKEACLEELVMDWLRSENIEFEDEAKEQ
jgi:hypothetical protein